MNMKIVLLFQTIIVLYFVCIHVDCAKKRKKIPKFNSDGQSSSSTQRPPLQTLYNGLKCRLLFTKEPLTQRDPILVTGFTESNQAYPEIPLNLNVINYKNDNDRIMFESDVFIHSHYKAAQEQNFSILCSPSTVPGERVNQRHAIGLSNHDYLDFSSAPSTQVQLALSQQSELDLQNGAIMVPRYYLLDSNTYSIEYSRKNVQNYREADARDMLINCIENTKKLTACKLKHKVNQHFLHIIQDYGLKSNFFYAKGNKQDIEFFFVVLHIVVNLPNNNLKLPGILKETDFYPSPERLRYANEEPDLSPKLVDWLFRKQKYYISSDLQNPIAFNSKPLYLEFFPYEAEIVFGFENKDRSKFTVNISFTSETFLLTGFRSVRLDNPPFFAYDALTKTTNYPTTWEHSLMLTKEPVPIWKQKIIQFQQWVIRGRIRRANLAKLRSG